MPGFPEGVPQELRCLGVCVTGSPGTRGCQEDDKGKDCVNKWFKTRQEFGMAEAGAREKEQKVGGAKSLQP